MSRHIEQLEDPPFTVGDRVRIVEDGERDQIHLIVGAQDDPRPVPSCGWPFWVIEEAEIENGAGGFDGFGPEHLEHI